MAGPRFPFPSFPNGWFRLAWSAELRPGHVRPVRALGRDLVLLRGQDGVARAFDAHCPHLGAHLGVGGRLRDGQLECPFHGWRFGGDGACLAAPGAARVPPARLKAWPLREWCGAILVWHHALGQEPQWEMPAVPEHGAADWTRFRPANAWTIRSHSQEFGENGMDLAHFPFLHHQQTAAIRTEDVAAEGPVFRHRTWQRYAIFGLARLFVREVSGPLEVELAGPGCALNRAGVSAGIELRYLYQFFFTPLDEERVEMVSQIAMRRVGGPLVEGLLLRKAVREGARTIEQDIPIWENKRYRERPLLSEADGPILQYRRWARQFYSSPKPAET